MAKKPHIGTIKLSDTDASDKLNISIVKPPGGRRHYVIKSEEALNFPRLLLNRINENKKKNQEIYDELLVLKKKYFKLTNKIRIQNAISVADTIEIT